MAFYNEFNPPGIIRTNDAHLPSLQAQLQAQDPTALVGHTPSTKTYIVSKATAWTAPQITGTLNIINNAPAVTDQLLAQDQIDSYPIFIRALIFTLLDEINILRANDGLAPRTPAQAIQAIRNKASTL